jgi:Nucleoside 2-deoxyribosyltransferase/pfkB family carbohydrate kinase
MMSNLSIVGGIYAERCIQPLWDAVYGSAGRAAQSVAGLVPGKVSLISYVAEPLRPQAEHLASDCGVDLVATPARYSVSFDYLHPLSVPVIRPSVERMTPHDAIRVAGEVVLRFGMLEGDAIVDAEKAIYDPQSAFGVSRFKSNGSRADRLAVIMNRIEAQHMTGHSDPETAASSLVESGEAEIVIVKMGGSGALLLSRNGKTIIPAYCTKRVWKLGSGDVFSAVFAALWGCVGIEPARAADLASRATAHYCDTRSLSVCSIDEISALSYDPVVSGKGLIYLAGPFFDLGQRWLVEEARTLFGNLGADVFSPIHEVGPGPASVVAPEDIAGLEKSDVVFAILNGLDTGTVFEVGYAVKQGIPVVGLAQNIKEEDLKMMEGMGCDISDDFASALYRTVWKLPPA